MKHFLPILVLSLALLSCGGTGKPAGKTPGSDLSALLAEAGDDVSAQRFDAAMDKALQALALSRTIGGG